MLRSLVLLIVTGALATTDVDALSTNASATVDWIHAPYSARVEAFHDLLRHYHAERAHPRSAFWDYKKAAAENDIGRPVAVNTVKVESPAVLSISGIPQSQPLACRSAT